MSAEAVNTLRQLLSERRARIAAAHSVDEIRQITAPQNLSIPSDIDLREVDAGGVPATWVSTDNVDTSMAILYLHGGGYVFGSMRSRYELAARLSRAASMPVLVVGYRLAPEHPFPAALEDARASYRWLLSEGVDPGHIVVIGDSAGGGLAAALLLALRDEGKKQPTGGVLLSPWVDLTCRADSMTRLAEQDPLVERERLLEWAGYYAAETDPQHPYISPLVADLTDIPPLMIQVGSDERLLDDATRFAERARSAGVDVAIEVWDKMFHNWHIYASLLPAGMELQERDDAIDHIARFARSRVSVEPTPTAGGTSEPEQFRSKSRR